MKILGLIPAKGMSMRIPYKNLVDLGGRPLIEWTIAAAKESGVCDVVVSSEDSRIHKVAHLAGVTVLSRPDDLAKSDTPSMDVVRHAVANIPCDLLILLQPTSPFRTAEDIRATIDIFDRTGCDSVVSVTTQLDHSGKLTFGFGHAGRLRPKPCLMENGAIFAITTDALRAGEDWYSGICHGYEMPPDRAIDIDTLADLEEARAILARRKVA